MTYLYFASDQSGFNSIKGVILLVYLSLFFILIPRVVLSQTLKKEIKGIVVNENETPIEKVNIRIKEFPNNTSITNREGEFVIEIPSAYQPEHHDLTLVLTSIGYEKKEIKIEDKYEVKIVLESGLSKLNELVVVGYTEQKRMNTTASISTLSKDEIENAPSINPIQAIQGKVAGLTVPITSGQPGSNPGMIIRGGTNMDGAGSPLIIVDGVFRSMNDIDPNDIESIQVLKDAAATAAYGARGGNGVIVVTTKSGEFNKKATVTVKFLGQLETQARNYDYLNAREYLELGRITWASGTNIYDAYTKLFKAGNSVTVPRYSSSGEWAGSIYIPAYLDNLIEIEGQDYVDDLLNNKGYELLIDPVNYGKQIIFKDNKYQDIVWKNAFTQNYDVSVDGGTNDFKYYFSLGYANQQGVFIGTNYKRWNTNLRTTYKVSDRIKLNTDLSFSTNNMRDPHHITNTMTRGVRITPLNRIFNEDTGEPLPGEYISVRYQPHELASQKRKNANENLVMRLESEIELLKGFNFKPSISYFMSNNDISYFEEAFDIQPRPRDKSLTRNSSRQLMIDQILDYKRSFNHIHNLNFLVGFNYTKVDGLNFKGTGQRSNTDYLSTFSGDPSSSIVGGDVQPNFDITSTFRQEKTVSLFGQANYDFDERFLLTASLRRDGFSDFAPNNRFAFFPSLSVGWNIVNESFWNINLINHLKVRGSIGETGLSPLTYRNSYGSYNSSNYNNSGGILRVGLANPNLVWETTRILDFGLDLGILENRINITFDIYQKLTKDRLASLPLPSETGFKSMPFNIGTMSNKGFELAINALVFDANNFSWETNFSFAFNRTKVVKLPENGRERNRIDGGTIYSVELGKEIEVAGYAEGERPGGMWAFKSNGIFATDEEAQAKDVPKDLMVSASALGQPKHAGDVNWADLNGDGVIDSKDVIFMGYRMPDKIGGMQNSFKFGDITIRFSFDYALGHVINNGALARSMGNARAGNEGAVRFAKDEKVWHYYGQEDAIYPRYNFNDTDFGYANSLRHVKNNVGVGNGYSSDVDFYFEKGDWLAFRELSVQYDLPLSVAKKIGSSGITINGGVYNIGYLTRYTGLNPEKYSGFDPGDYPRPRQFNFGATIKF